MKRRSELFELCRYAPRRPGMLDPYSTVKQFELPCFTDWPACLMRVENRCSSADDKRLRCTRHSDVEIASIQLASIEDDGHLCLKALQEQCAANSSFW